MYRHYRSNMLTLGFDYQLTPEDVKAWQHIWTSSKRGVDKLSRLEVGGKFKKRF